MSKSLPSADDRTLWDIHMSGLTLPSLTAADEVGIFEALAGAPAGADELAQRLKLNARAIRALLPLLASAGLLSQRLGRYHVSETARDYLVPSSRFYWGPVFTLMRNAPFSHPQVLQALRAPEAAAHWDATPDPENPTNAWSEGQIAPELARAIAAYMNANSLKIAYVAAERLDLSRTQRLLDIGAGSGCFSIAFAAAYPVLRCTMMDLKGMGEVAMEYVRDNGLSDRIDTCTVDMFRQEWPRGYDALFFSNIFHDWDFKTCALLAGKAFSCLPSGGRILLHEMLLDDTHDSPRTAAAFSVYMLLATKGQQFTFLELQELLKEAGFESIEVTETHGYYSVVSGVKP